MSPLRSFADQKVDSYAEDVREWILSAIPDGWRATPIEELDFSSVIGRRREWDRIVGQGPYAGIAWPTDVGGRGEGPIEEFLFFTEAAAAHAPDTANSIGLNLAGPVILSNGTDSQKKRFLPAVLRGEEFWCEGFSEPNAGSDLASVTTTATKVEGGWRIHGQKTWTSRAQFADRCYLLARTSTTLPRHHNLSVFLLDMHQPGIDVRPIRQISDIPEFNEVFFDGAFAADEELLGAENHGWGLGGLSGVRQRRRVFDALRWWVQVKETLDQLERCAEHCFRTSRRLAELRIRCQTLHAHIQRTAELMASDAAWLGPATVLRMCWTELWQELAEVGLQLGCAQHEDYWRLRYLETRAATIHGGTAQIQRNVVADRVLELPRA